jgi:hypothetical protein
MSFRDWSVCFLCISEGAQHSSDAAQGFFNGIDLPGEQDHEFLVADAGSYTSS